MRMPREMAEVKDVASDKRDLEISYHTRISLIIRSLSHISAITHSFRIRYHVTHLEIRESDVPRS